MIKKYLINGVAVLALGLTVVSCSKDTDFSNADAVKHAESVLGVSIDPTQDWKMTQEVSAYVTVNFGTGEKYTVYVFDKSPFDNDDAVYYAKKTVSDATVTTLPMSIPSALTELYVSVFDSKKHSYSKRVAVNGEYVNVVFGSPMEGSYAPALTRSGNLGAGYVSYPATHEYTDANGNVVAGANMNHNQWGSSDLQSMPFGGWIVPDPLTPGQKERVKAYFQANPNLGHQDPKYANFFVQQVYTGGTAVPETGNKESTTAADGKSSYNASNMNQLTVGEANSHINDFNAGTCTTSQVLYNDGTTKGDQITLMVNVDDTSCFGYHDTGGSNVKGKINHNDKWALVSAEDIDAWAEANGIGGDPVVDKWNRSFMGFDHELLPESDLVTDDYALLSQVPNLNNIPYAWDGTNVMIIGEKPTPAEPVAAGTEVDVTSAFAYCYNGTVTNNENGIVFVNNGWGALQAYNAIAPTVDWTSYAKFVIEFAEATPTASTITINGAFNETIPANTLKYEKDLTGNNYTNVSNGAELKPNDPGTFKISKIYLVTGETAVEEDNNIYYNPTYLLGDTDADKIAFYSTNTNMYGGTILDLTEDEMKTTQDGKICLNLVKFRQLKNDGYHPISTDLKKWVKWEAACDGYYSDWIVTLCEAQRIDKPEEHNEEVDVTPAIYSYAFEDSWMADYDMNDVVLKVQQNAEDENMIDITLCCTGASYNLYIFINIDGFDYRLFQGSEVHEILGGTPGKFINTGDDNNEKFQTCEPQTVTINKPTDATTTLGTLDIWIKSPEKNIHVAGEKQDPHGVVIPEDWKWPTEWTSIKTAYPKFIEFAKDQTQSTDWYKHPSSTPGLIYGE